MAKNNRDWLSKLRCPKCGSEKLKLMPGRKGNWGAWGVPGVSCVKCRERYPVVEGGILRMIPEGDYSRYAYWEDLHSKTPPSEIAALYKRRFAYPDKFLLHYYVMARLALRLGWKAEDSIELGSQWGSNSLTLYRFGVSKRVWLLDISVAALKGALAFYREFGLTPYAIQGEIHGLPFRDQALDLSLSGGLYEHFVGVEQEALIRENCRISKKVLCQVPENSLAYKVYRQLVTWWYGKWPFGFESAVSYVRLANLFERAGATIEGRDYHNLASALWMIAGERSRFFRAFAFRPFFFYLVRHDAVIAANSGGKHGNES